MRIDFDQKYLTKAFYWKGEECQELLKYGTTQEKPVVLPKPEMSIRQANIFFQFDRSDLNGAMSNISLAEIIREIKKSNSTRISIQGYADTLGKDTYNQRLSEHRTSSLVAYLIAQGIPSQYILVDAHGSTEQYRQCQSEPSHAEKVNCLAPNRRVSIAW